MLARLSSALLVGILCGTECVYIEPLEYGRIEVFAFAANGERIQDLDIELAEVGTKRSPRSEVRGPLAGRVPYGAYQMRVSAPGFLSVGRQLRLYQPEISVRVQLVLGMECQQAYGSLGGTIKNGRGDRDLWVKVIPVWGVGGGEARVSRHGYFLLAGLDSGSYLLMVLDGKTVLHMETAEVYGKKSITVDLANR